MKHMMHVLALVGLLVVGILSLVGIARGVRYVVRIATATAEPHYSMCEKDTVCIDYQKRAYMARYEQSIRTFEVLEDHRFGWSCKPRVEVGNVFVLDYHCDEKGNTDKHPERMYKTIDGLDSPTADDFYRFRPMADAYYAEATKPKIAEAR